jgi:hypothetical protein
MESAHLPRRRDACHAPAKVEDDQEFSAGFIAADHQIGAVPCMPEDLSCSNGLVDTVALDASPGSPRSTTLPQL